MPDLPALMSDLERAKAAFDDPAIDPAASLRALAEACIRAYHAIKAAVPAAPSPGDHA